MSVIVSIRSGSISDTLKKYAETKAEKLVETYPKITSARFVLDMQKARCKAELIIRGKNLDVEADHESFDLYESVDEVIEKVDSQLKKRLDKLQDHKSLHNTSIKEMEQLEVEKPEEEVE